MKKVLLSVVMIATSLFAYGQGQWSGSTNSTGPIGRSGSVNIGTPHTNHVNDRLIIKGGDLRIIEDTTTGDDDPDLYIIDRNGNGLDLWIDGGTENAYLQTIKPNMNLVLGAGNWRKDLFISPTGTITIPRVMEAGTVKVTGHDFCLGTGGIRPIGTKTGQRALVHWNNDQLLVNFDGDFEGGVRVDGPGLFVGGSCLPAGYRLSVEGKIRARGLKVDASTWCDYVFEESYNLRSIADLEQYIKSEKHLPEIPTTAEVMAEGIEVSDMSALFLKKIEELTLYIITLNNEITELKKHQIGETK